MPERLSPLSFPLPPPHRPYLGESSAISAGVVWAGNPSVTDTIDAIDASEAARGSRYTAGNKPLVIYRGSKDSVMTPWAQTTLQARFNASGVRLDLFAVPNATHSGLFPEPTVQFLNGNPINAPHLAVLNHSYAWITGAMGLKMAP